jgi:HD-GYP domain-containing protein (c-di-GMP phosphodiesterase class II)
VSSRGWIDPEAAFLRRSKSLQASGPSPRNRRHVFRASPELGSQTLAIAELRDITDQRQREHQLLVQNWALSTFSIAAVASCWAQTAGSFEQSICEAITLESSSVLAWIGVADGGLGKEVRVAASLGSAAGYPEGLSNCCSDGEAKKGAGPAGLCIRSGKLVIVEDNETLPIFVSWREQAKRYGKRSCAYIPLQIEGSWHGARIVYSAYPRAFEPAPAVVFKRLSEPVGHGDSIARTQVVEPGNLERAQKHLTSALAASVSAMVTAMEMQDPYTAGHESRFRDIAYAIGKEMGWTEHRLEGLRMAALVHDIGKISIPAEILNKSRRCWLSRSSGSALRCSAKRG